MMAIALWLSLLLVAAAAIPAIERWGRFELEARGPSDSDALNPFVNVIFGATFVHESSRTSLALNGFYDGGGRYVLRFSPALLGVWTYNTTATGAAALAGIRGSLNCTPGSPGNRGPVVSNGATGFAYANGEPAFPLGTTSYAWASLANDTLANTTLASINASVFNKLRFALMPKWVSRFPICSFFA